MTQPAARVVTLGETMALLDPVSDGELALGDLLRLRIAGAESNFAVGLAAARRRGGVDLAPGRRPAGRARPRGAGGRGRRSALGRRGPGRADRPVLQVARRRAHVGRLLPARVGGEPAVRGRRARRGAPRRRARPSDRHHDGAGGGAADARPRCGAARPGGGRDRHVRPELPPGAVGRARRTPRPRWRRCSSTSTGCCAARGRRRRVFGTADPARLGTAGASCAPPTAAQLVAPAPRS